MTKLSALSFSCLLVFISGCQQGSKSGTQSESTDQQDIVGTWSNLSMKISYIDSDSIYDVPEGKWEALLNIKPILTTYRADGTFDSKYYALNDSLLFISAGQWEFRNDSLLLTTPESTTAYKFTINGNIGEFRGLLDWDQNGTKMELYEGRQVKH